MEIHFWGNNLRVLIAALPTACRHETRLLLGSYPNQYNLPSFASVVHGRMSGIETRGVTGT